MNDQIILFFPQLGIVTRLCFLCEKSNKYMYREQLHGKIHYWKCYEW